MLSSSPSQPLSIKIQHRASKKRATRRRRIDCTCGCSIYVHINCSNHGFTHRGIHHCASGREWRLYMGDNKSPLFQDNKGRGSSLHQHQDLPHQHQIQPQPEESIGSPQSIPQFPGLDDISDSFWDDIFK
ncbi:transactivating protein [Sida yellow mosaic Alagoas virus]|uniref:Transcriptional activator protein n=1 Tax=Sida yellow mosaic Alagoas virus TaxID=1266994 RepID=L7Y840_9GEMI|nr:transactivating protein [Sida yellow mosaic Alagoas virus]AGD98619.1 transactivating protein [Sida yellow mosaic Alagoas virus]